MTFDEWFAREFAEMFANTDTDPYQFESAAQQAWQAAQDDVRREQAQIRSQAQQIAARISDAIDVNVTKMVESYPVELQAQILENLAAHYEFPTPKEVDSTT